jgi:hypothetical protein
MSSGPGFPFRGRGGLESHKETPGALNVQSRHGRGINHVGNRGRD